MLEFLTRLGDIANLETFLAAIAGRGGFDPGDAAPIVEGIGQLPSGRAASMMTRLIAGAAEGGLTACGALLARGVALGLAVVLDAAKTLVDALPAALAPDRWRRGPEVTPGLIVDLFTALPFIQPALADRAATHILTWPATYDLDTVLVPAVRQMLGSGKAGNSAALERLRLGCVAHLETRIAQPLAAPRDWGRPNSLTCTCRHCAAPGRFLADPANARWVLRANEADRVHVEGSIRTARCDVDTMTERRGRPYSLICTKNQASYERRRTQRADDLANVEHLARPSG